ncbi:Crp/Fnr family transcriptional regulator [Rhizosphaericola mali]|uniref:Crp/Fnr family transcriptional regulator n=1 Tax=Rhizosphaericola mali TaxID=2545455 RepID=A0A5P2GFZ4_9BACT|nr:hypothetical protein [Rhizosphaericola mali]QES90581.1 hypothetical protein E0W69_018605 [Rhizosphaericola mali]
MQVIEPQAILKFHLSQIAIFTEEELRRMEKILKLGHARAGQLLYAPKEKLSTLAWLPISGILRGYRYVDCVDRTFCFSNPYCAFGNVYYYVTGYSDDVYMEAATDVIYIYFDYKDLIALEKEIPKVEKIRSYIIKMTNIFVTNILTDMCTKDLKTRYLELIEREPILFQLIPQYQIASYLGVEPQSLSRLKAQIKKEMVMEV